MTDGTPKNRRQTFARPALVLMGLCTLIELALQLGEIGLVDVARVRAVAIEYAGFWPGLLANWQPNYPFQAGLMFVTYGFLHAGLLHLALNMITLLSLANPVIARVGNLKFLTIYSLSLLGGGAGYALLAGNLRPMVGASGALFGLAGAILAWEYVDRFTRSTGLWPVARAALLLAALNVALYYAMGGTLAWEAHLGGFVAGWVVALLVDPRMRS